MDDTSKAFRAIDKSTISSILARDECEKYCNATDDCWGCTLNCEKDCNWIAITNCDEIKMVGSEKGGLAQKPGNRVTNFNHF